MIKLNLELKSNNANVLLADSKKFAYDKAHSIALRVLELLRPHCIRCEIAGSLNKNEGGAQPLIAPTFC